MRDINKVFHLAIPCKDLDERAEFYGKLGCKLARRYPDRVTFNFFGDQVVCHLSPESVEALPKMYPRH
jgi:extradiol dioxygenase family protein